MNKDQEEFEKLRKRLYALADKMGMQLTMTLRRQNAAMAGKPCAPSASKAGSPAVAESSRRREPGEE